MKKQTKSTAGRVFTIEPAKSYRLRVVLEAKWENGASVELCAPTDPWDADNLYSRGGDGVTKMSIRESVTWFRTIVGNRIVKTITWDASEMCKWLSRVASHVAADESIALSAETMKEAQRDCDEHNIPLEHFVEQAVRAQCNSMDDPAVVAGVKAELDGWHDWRAAR